MTPIVLKCSTGWISVAVEMVTPQMAEEFLQRNHPRNRHQKLSHILKMAIDLNEGRWVFTHEGIAFDTSGNLIDGQNRLQAIIKANKLMEVMVFRNLHSSALAPMGHGVKRTIHDSLTIDGLVLPRKAVEIARGMF